MGTLELCGDILQSRGKLETPGLFFKIWFGDYLLAQKLTPQNYVIVDVDVFMLSITYQFEWKAKHQFITECAVATKVNIDI